MNNYNDIPIFPLKSIILPGGQFPLRIFERRYLDMIRDSLKTNSGFVIALTKKDADYISSVHDYACYVEIVDWSQLDGGLLGITVEGKKIVTLSNCELNEGNLLIGHAKEIESSVDHLIPAKYQILSRFYRKIYPEIKAYIQVRDLTKDDKDEVFVFNGWMFSSSPSIAPFDHSVYDIWLVDCY